METLIRIVLLFRSCPHEQLFLFIFVDKATKNVFYINYALNHICMRVGKSTAGQTERGVRRLP